MAAWRRFVSCARLLPADHASQLWQLALTEARRAIFTAIRHAYLFGRSTSFCDIVRQFLVKAALGWRSKEVSMAYFHETSNPKPAPQIDTVGWLFAAFVVVATAIAAITAYALSQ